jgi:hypothetical protein
LTQQLGIAAGGSDLALFKMMIRSARSTVKDGRVWYEQSEE